MKFRIDHHSKCCNLTYSCVLNLKSKIHPQEKNIINSANQSGLQHLLGLMNICYKIMNKPQKVTLFIKQIIMGHSLKQLLHNLRAEIIAWEKRKLHFFSYLSSEEQIEQLLYIIIPNKLSN